jgi:hypothetical protein
LVLCCHESNDLLFFAKTDFDLRKHDEFRPDTGKVCLANPKIFVLVNTKDTTRKIGLKKKYFLNYSDSWSDSLIIRKEVNLEGKISHVDHDRLIFATDNENIELTNKDKSMSFITNTYCSGKNWCNVNQKPIEIAKTNYLRYSTPVRKVLNGVGGTLLSMGLLSALVVAPIASINYKTATIDKSKYTTIALIGLSAVVVSVPLFITGRPKNYKLVKKNQTRDKDYWYIDEQKNQ